MTVRWKLALGVAGVLGVAYLLGRRASAKPHPGGVDAPDSNVTLSMYVRKDGKCYLVEQLAGGGSRSRVVSSSLCDNPPDLGGPI